MIKTGSYTQLAWILLGALISFLTCLFIYFWFCWVFVAMHGAYSLSAVCRLLIAVVSLLTEPEHWLLGAWASVVAAHGFSAWGSGLQRMGSIVVPHGLSCSEACGIFPDQGFEPVSPVLAVGFLIIDPPMKSWPSDLLTCANAWESCSNSSPVTFH